MQQDRFYSHLSMRVFEDISYQRFPSSFQQAVLKNVNERNAQMQKQLENVVREGQ